MTRFPATRATRCCSWSNAARRRLLSAEGVVRSEEGSGSHAIQLGGVLTLVARPNSRTSIPSGYGRRVAF